MLVEVDRAVLSADSGEESGCSGDDGGVAIAVRSDRTQRPRSNVASGIREALAALDAGRVDLVRYHLGTLLKKLADGKDPALTNLSPGRAVRTGDIQLGKNI
jgi:hypothetical protein